LSSISEIWRRSFITPALTCSKWYDAIYIVNVNHMGGFRFHLCPTVM
jgi:hypothetical protein